MSDQSIALTQAERVIILKTARLIALCVSAIVCSEGDPERFFDSIEIMKRLESDADDGMSLSPEVLDLLAKTVQTFNEVLRTDAAAQEY
ncbi:MAG: hypothetical protein F4151_16495 [Gammaproteobacteria bacterium]|nr:hypothetical protein [Gammaproteobacteria bacterium]